MAWASERCKPYITATRRSAPPSSASLRTAQGAFRGPTPHH